jgi:hypothetical protein
MSERDLISSDRLNIIEKVEKPARPPAQRDNGGGQPFAPIKGEDDREIVLVNAADIEPEPVNWL